MKKEEFIKSVLQNNQGTASSTVYLISGSTEVLELSIVELLQLNSSKLTPEARHIIDILENDKDFGCREEYQQFKWMILSYINIQDAFPSVVYNGADNRILFARHYFYYEALSILREYFYCGLNNMIVSANHLVRTFIEFNLRQCYFIEKAKREQSFSSIREYLKSGIAPSNETIIKFIFPSNSFCKPIKKCIQTVLKGLSESSSHAFDPVHSVRNIGKLGHEYSIDSLVFWLKMFGAFNTVLWSYYITLPTILKPRDVVRKFGFNYVPGLFITDYQYAAVKKSLGDDLPLFIQNEPIKAELQNLDDIFDNLPDLTDAEIVKTWTNKEDLKSFIHGYAMLTAQMRVINESLASKFTADDTQVTDLKIGTDLGLATKYSFWEKNYKKL